MIVPRKPYSLSIEEVLRLFNTTKDGISLKEVFFRQKIFGKNVLKEEKINYFKIFFRQFSGSLIYILLAAAVFSLFVGKHIDFFAIILMVLINGLIGFYQEIKSEISIKALKKLTESRDRVIRDNKVDTVYSSELVPGDVVLLFEGSVVSADLRLIESSNLVIDESSLTGESVPVEKNHSDILTDTKVLEYDCSNMAFTGTTVVRGTAKAVVTATGKDTYLASIAQKAKERSPDSPFARAIRYFAGFYIVFLTVVLSGIGVYGIIQGRDIVNVVYILIAEMVSAVPEGLPIVVTLVMVCGALVLSKKKTLVRYLPSVETLGSATVIASDKTGTITEGKIVVKETFEPENKGFLKLIAALCNDSHEGKGDPIDVSLSKWADDINKKDYYRIWNYSFDSKLRIMAAAYRIDEEEKILVKGAFESLKKKCVNDESEIKVFEKKLESMSLKGLRVLAFGIGEFKNENVLDHSIKIIGLVGFLDPAKKGVKEAVKEAQKAGIKVMMITGDYPLTAKAIAEEVGIYHEGDDILVGSDVENLSTEELFLKLKKTSVLARILPEHKYEVVKLLQERGDVVTVTGDGVNDVPALKKADLGIAMGNGVEAAKSVAKMIITDGNLKVVVDAIKNGRVIADNIRKVIYYLLSSSTQELFFISFAVIFSLPLPLTPIQILWINLVTDGVQDKTFPFAGAENDVMKRLPIKPQKQFFDKIQMFRITFFGLFMGVLSLFFYKYLLKTYSYDLALTISFTSVVMSQWVNGIQSQKQREPFFKNIKKSFAINPYIFLGVGFGVLLQLFAVYGASNIFNCVPLSLKYWKYPVFLSCSAFFVVELRKWMEIFFLFLKNRIFKKSKG